jgi:hypothetical protein
MLSKGGQPVQKPQTHLPCTDQGDGRDPHDPTRTYQTSIQLSKECEAEWVEIPALGDKRQITATLCQEL